jgi:hypothetical protein
LFNNCGQPKSSTKIEFLPNPGGYVKDQGSKKKIFPGINKELLKAKMGKNSERRKNGRQSHKKKKYPR